MTAPIVSQNMRHPILGFTMTSGMHRLMVIQHGTRRGQLWERMAEGVRR